MYHYIFPYPLPCVACETLKKKRLERGWSQYHVAANYYVRFGKTLKISQIENGDDSAWQPVRERLSILFEMPEHELFPELYNHPSVKKVLMTGVGGDRKHGS